MKFSQQVTVFVFFLVALTAHTHIAAQSLAANQAVSTPVTLAKFTSTEALDVATEARAVSPRHSVTFNRSIAPTEANFPDVGDYLAKHIEYPQIAESEGLSGEVRLRVHLDARGTAHRVEVLDAPPGGFAEAVQSAVLAMPRWTPATQYGVPVGSVATIAVSFVR